MKIQTNYSPNIIQVCSLQEMYCFRSSTILIRFSIKTHGSESQGQEEAACMRVFWPTRPLQWVFTRMAAVKFWSAISKPLQQISLRNTYPTHVLPRLNQQPKDRLNRRHRFYYSAILRLMALPFETSPNRWQFRAQLTYYYSMSTFDV